MQHASSRMLYSHISTPQGLQKWYADKVVVRGDEYTFMWGDEENKAKLSSTKENKSAKFKWLAAEDAHCYLEMHIMKDELTGDVALAVTDFCTEEEREERIMIWNSNIEMLSELMGV